jgi:hypothetical protein
MPGIVFRRTSQSCSDKSLFIRRGEADRPNIRLLRTIKEKIGQAGRCWAQFQLANLISKFANFVESVLKEGRSKSRPETFNARNYLCVHSL